MNLLNKLTIKNLKMNKKRTIVTIIGIILSTALIAGVATLVTSFSQTMINYVKQETGNYHYEFSDVPVDEIKYIENNRNIQDIYITQNIGYALLENSKNEYKPYLHIQGFDSKALEHLNLDLVEGRMPKNENELVISGHIEYNGGVKYEVGDMLTLNIGKRTLEGYELNQHNPYVNEDGEVESFEAEYTKKYKIVGIIERPSYTTEDYSAPGYTVITYLENYENISGTTNIYTVYKDLNKQYETTAQILDVDSEAFKEGTIWDTPKYNYEKNETLIQWEILEFSDSTVSMLYSVAAIIIAIIIFTSVFCIRNSFEISITERIKQYGMLASVGATSKQIRKNVLYEGLILGIIGIPLGILSGLFAIFILLQVVQNILGDMLGDDFTFVFKTSVLAILVSVLLCGITIYLSAKKSAKKASKVSPIDAIRNSQEIKIKKRKSLKTSKLIKKVFGVGGDIANKNLKRNKKKYRATVISIVVSVSVFIAMSSFFSYAFKANNMHYVKIDYNITISPINYLSYEEIEFNKINEIISQSSVKEYSILNNIHVNVERAELEKHYSKKYKEIYSERIKDSSPTEVMTITAINEEEHRRFAKEIGIDYDKVKNKAILIDDMQKYVIDENGKGKYELFRIYDYQKGDKIQFEFIDDGEAEKSEIEIITTTDKRPMGLEGTYYHAGYIIVGEEWFNNYKEYSENNFRVYINSKDTQELATFVDDNFPNEFYVYDYEEEIRQQNSMWLVIAIFIYGFIIVISLIGVTSIFNTITTNMNLRSKEFANLKSIGMTKKEFSRMIRLESIFYCGKSLLFGILIGIGLSYLIYMAFGEGIEMVFLFPWQGIIISAIAVAILITVIMQYSLNKINKQNIIETIRKDNI